MVKREARSEHVGVRFRMSELAELDRAAVREGISRSEFIREGVATLVVVARLGNLDVSDRPSQSDGPAAPGTSARGS